MQALLSDRARQTRLDDLQAVLHIHLSQFRVGARLEGGGDGGAAQAALRLEVQQVVGTVELLLDQADDALIDCLCRCTRVDGIDLYLWRGYVRVLGHRQLRDGQRAGQQNEQRDHPGEHRAVNEKLRH